jgi:hypothetical protein
MAVTNLLLAQPHQGVDNNPQIHRQQIVVINLPVNTRLLKIIVKEHTVQAIIMILLQTNAYHMVDIAVRMHTAKEHTAQAIIMIRRKIFACHLLAVARQADLDKVAVAHQADLDKAEVLWELILQENGMEL